MASRPRRFTSEEVRDEIFADSEFEYLKVTNLAEQKYTMSCGRLAGVLRASCGRLAGSTVRP